MSSLSNDYQRWLYYRSFPRATAWPCHTSYSDTYCCKNLRASDILGTNTLPRVWSNTKCIILYYYCTDETSKPEITPECSQCARHTKYSLYFQHLYLWANSQTDDAKTGAFPLPRWVLIPCLRAHSLWFHFLGLLCVFSSDSLEGYWAVRIGLIPVSPGLEHFTQGKWPLWMVWAVRLQPVTILQWLHAQIKTKHTGQEHLMSFKFSWFGGNWLLCAHPQLSKMSQHS